MWACRPAESELKKAEATAFRNDHYLILTFISQVFLNSPTRVMFREDGDPKRSVNIKLFLFHNLKTFRCLKSVGTVIRTQVQAAELFSRQRNCNYRIH